MKTTKNNTAAEVTINHPSGNKTIVCSYEYRKFCATYMGYEDRVIGYVYEVFLYSPCGSEHFMGGTDDARNVRAMIEASREVSFS